MRETTGVRAQRAAERLVGVSLEPPAFGGAAWARFDLGRSDQLFRPRGLPPFDLPGPWSRRRRRVREAVDRAATVFETLVGTADRGFVVAYVWPDERPESEERFLAVLPGHVRAEVDRAEGTNYWDDPDGNEPFLRLTAACALRELDYRLLFQMLGNEDLALEPALSGRVFLVDETNPVVFHMYDDRGADVYASDSTRLAAVTAAWSSWLLESGDGARR